MNVAIETLVLRAFMLNHIQRFGLHKVHVLHLENTLRHFHRRVHVYIA